MEFSSSTTTIFGVFSFLLFLYYYILWKSKFAKRNSGRNKPAPEAAGAWPIIGHLHLLGGSGLPHLTLGSMADKFGPIFTIKLGLYKAVVVSDWKMAKECFTTNDKIFATRPKSIVVELIGYNYAIFAFTPYGSYWRQLRKIAVLELLSNRRIEMLGHIRTSELKASIKVIHEFWLKNKDASNMVKIEMKHWFGNLTLNIIVRIIAGKRYSSDDKDVDQSHMVIRKYFELLGMFLVSDAIPFLRWFDLGGHEKVMKEIAKEIDYTLEGWLQEHKRKRNLGQVKGEQQDFLDVMLSILDEASSENLPAYDPDTIIKATCLVMLSAGTDTTTVTLTWALSLLLNNPNALKKAQDEINIHIGKERRVQQSDIKNLTYLQAILKETLRLYPPATLSLPHESMEDCTVGGYNIPKGTRLVVNLWKIHHDPHVWPDPFEFRPERFLTNQKDIDVLGQHFELIPFGSGRRLCPGISLAFHIMELTLATLIHGFEIKMPSNEQIDMNEEFGITNMKATPLEVLLSPRLSPNLYE